MRRRFTGKTLGIGSQANAAGYTALTGQASCERSKNANSGTWTVAYSAKYVLKTLYFILVTWIAASSARHVGVTPEPFLITLTAAPCAENVPEIIQYTSETCIDNFSMELVFNHVKKTIFITTSVELNCNILKSYIFQYPMHV